MRIKDLCEDDRPREKMITHGASVLTNAELLAILLRTGTKTANVMEVARYLLQSADESLTKASQMSIDSICKISGIGKCKAVAVMAALELGKRMCGESPDNSRIIKCSLDVFREMLPVMHGLRHEECWILYLARNNRIIAKERLSIGGQSETIVEIKTIARRAIETFASAVIMIHNHPSGDPKPGQADIKLTQTLKRALDTFSIPLIDHIVISDGKFYSFSDQQEYSFP